MRKGICKQYGKCSLAENSVSQEIINDSAPFECAECHQLLEEISITVVQKPLPKWYIPLIGLIIFIAAIVTFFIVPPAIEPPAPPDPPKPQQKVIFTEIIADKDIFFERGERKAYFDTIGPFTTNIPVDSIYWKVSDQPNGFTIEPENGYDKTIVIIYSRPENDDEGSVTFEIAPILNGQTGEKMEFSRNFKIKPSKKAKVPIQLTKSGSKIMLKSNQKVVEIPKQLFSTNQPKPDEVQWKLNKNTTSKGISFSNLPLSGSGFIPPFSASFTQAPAVARIVFDVQPIKKDFETVKSTFTITIVGPAPAGGSPCGSAEMINAYNQNSQEIIKEFEESLIMISKNNDPVIEKEFILGANRQIRKINDISVQVVGFSSLSEFLNSGFTNIPKIQEVKNECNKITRIMVTP